MCKHFFENVGSALIPGEGARQAANAQTTAAEYGINAVSPWMQPGLNAFNAYNMALGLGGPGAGGGNAWSPSLYPNQSSRGNTPIQDIQAALAAGNPVSDQSYLTAGFGTGGAGLNGGPSYQDYISGAYKPTAAGGATGADPYGGFRASPGYQWAYDQGQRAVNNAFAARGGLNSGARVKAAMTYGQGLADQDFNSYLNNLFRSAGLGYSATEDYANLWQNKGAAQASRPAGIANAWSQILGSALTGGGGMGSSYGSTTGAASAASNPVSLNSLMSFFGL